MMFEETFLIAAQESMNVYVEQGFDNNFLVEAEYENWKYEFLDRDAQWWPFSYEDLTIAQVDEIMQSCGEYCDEINNPMPQSIRSLLTCYGWLLEQTHEIVLYEQFNDLMREKQISLENNLYDNLGDTLVSS